MPKLRPGNVKNLQQEHKIIGMEAFKAYQQTEREAVLIS